MADFSNSFLAEDDHAAVHEDALVFEINDQTLGWRPSGLALKRASDQGHDIGEILAGLQTLFHSDLSEEDLEEMSEEEVEEALEVQGGLADLLSLVAKVIWIGTLHFEPESRQENVLALLNAENVRDVPLEEMLSRIFPAIEEEASDEDEADSGKAQEEDSGS